MNSFYKSVAWLQGIWHTSTLGKLLLVVELINENLKVHEETYVLLSEFAVREITVNDM